MAAVPLLLNLWVKFLGDSAPGFRADFLLPDSAAARALRFWAERGFPLAQVEFLGAFGDTAYFSVEKGPLVVVSRVQAEGMPGRLKRELLGKPFNPKKLEELSRLTEALGMGPVRAAGFSKKEEGFSLLLDGPEAKGWASGGAGWGEGGLFGSLELAFRNLGLWGREARLTWERHDEARGELRALAVEPFLLGTGLWLRAEGGALYAESLHVKRWVRGLLGIQTPGWGLWAGEGWEASAEPGTERVRWPALLRLELRRPLKGSASLDAWSDYWRAEAELKLPLKLKATTLTPGVRAGEVRGGLSGDLFWLGGAEPPHGFRPGSVGAARFWVAWAEAALPTRITPLALLERFWTPSLEGWTWGLGLRAQGTEAALVVIYARGLVHAKLSLAL